jgi:serine/threonine-protein kinase
MWGRTAHAEVLKRLARGDHPRSPKGKRPGVHEELDRICRRALAYDPDDRYPTALAFQEDLDAFISEHERRPSPRQLGTFVSNLFAEQQERAKGIIQDQLKELVSSRRTVVTIDVAVDSESSDTDQQPFSEDSIPRSHTPSALMQSQRPAPIDTKLSPTPGPPRTGRSSLVVLVAIAVVALLFIGVGLSGVLGQGARQAPPATEVTLILRASPLEVHFAIDDGPAVENPYVGHVPIDTKTHRIRAEAPGYVSESEEVRFERDLSLRFSLGRVSP